MTVDRYIFQSPYSSAVQVGRPDPSVKKESDASSAELPKALNETVQKAQSFQETQKGEVKTTVSSNKLDIYV